MMGYVDTSQKNYSPEKNNLDMNQNQCLAPGSLLGYFLVNFILIWTCVGWVGTTHKISKSANVFIYIYISVTVKKVCVDLKTSKPLPNSC